MQMFQKMKQKTNEYIVKMHKTLMDIMCTMENEPQILDFFMYTSYNEFISMKPVSTNETSDWRLCGTKKIPL